MMKKLLLQGNQLRDNGELKEINDAYLWDKIKYKTRQQVHKNAEL
jgi:hypothetical protein